MAGTCKPAEAGKEMKHYEVIECSGIRVNKTGLFDGVIVNAYQGINVVRFDPNGGGDYIVIRFKKPCSIWRSGASGYKNYTGPFTIYKLNGDTFEDVTDKITQKVSAIGCDQWEKTIEKLEAGTYKFQCNNSIRVDTEWYLESLSSSIIIKKDNKYYASSEELYDSNTNTYKEVEDLSILSDIAIDDLFEYQNYLPDNKRPIDMFSGKINLIKLEYDEENEFSIMKSNRELVVAKDDIVNKTANTINSITLNTSVTEDGKLKLALSIDKGETWLTYIDKVWKSLEISIPSREYSLLNEEELIQWNNARDVIYENGIDSSEFNNINFNTLTDTEVSPDYIRFAYVIDRPTVNDKSGTTKMTWDYNSKGSMRKMKDSEYDIDSSDEQVTFTSNIDNEMIKINIEI